MKQLTCEMCGSTELVKQEGVFVCQSCGCKYSVEDAKKMMMEGISDIQATADIKGVVDIQGTVKIDKADDLNNLYELARRAEEEGNIERAKTYYGQILEIDPSSWEAVLYTTYYDSLNINTVTASQRLINAEELIFNLIEENVSDPGEKAEAVFTVATVYHSAAHSFFQYYKGRYEKHWVTVQDYASTCAEVRDIVYSAGDTIIEFFGDDYGETAVWCWRLGVLQHNELNRVFTDKQYNAGIIRDYIAKIQKYDPSYVPPTVNAGGCYVATCVYGSYDCPQVWTLRRFRDDTLGSTWYGRLFIRTYYAISPTLVKWFGNKDWFKKLWKGKLDRMVAKLQNNGVEDTPYEDKEW